MIEKINEMLTKFEGLPREISVSYDLYYRIKKEITNVVDGPMTVPGLKLVVDPLLTGENFEIIGDDDEDWRSEMIHFGL